MKSLENIIFLVPALTGLTYFIAGWFLEHRPPKKTNSMYGYRTSSSFKSQKHWDFAQIYSGKLLKKCGIVSILFSLLGFVFQGEGILQTTIVILFCVGVCMAVFIYTERALKQLD